MKISQLWEAWPIQGPWHLSRLSGGTNNVVWRVVLPAIWRLRDAASFVHRMGRYLAGLETDARIQDRVQHSLWREAWLADNQDTLVQHALQWRRSI